SGVNGKLPGVLASESFRHLGRDGVGGERGGQNLHELNCDVLRIGLPDGVRERHSGEVKVLLFLGRSAALIACEAHEPTRYPQALLGTVRSCGPLILDPGYALIAFLALPRGTIYCHGAPSPACVSCSGSAP